MGFWRVICLAISIVMPLTLTVAVAETKAYSSSECVEVKWAGHFLSHGNVVNGDEMCAFRRDWDIHTDINRSKGVIEFFENKYFARNMNSAAAMVLIDFPSPTDNAPLSDSEYFSDHYNLATTVNQKIYVRLGSNLMNGEYFIPFGDQLFLVSYFNFFQGAEFRFKMRLFKPDGAGLSFETWEVDNDQQAGGLSFSEQEALAGLEGNAGGDVQSHGLEFTEQEILRITRELDEGMLLACAANHAACNLPTSPIQVRIFMNISSEQLAIEAFRVWLETQSK